jgi:hypothetical protein
MDSQISEDRRKLLRRLGIAGVAGLFLAGSRLTPVSAANGNPLQIGQSNTGSASTPLTPASYIVYLDGSTYEAVNGTTGAVDSSNTDLATVLNYAITNCPSNGGTVVLRPTGTQTFHLVDSLYMRSYVNVVNFGKISVDADVDAIVWNAGHSGIIQSGFEGGTFSLPNPYTHSVFLLSGICVGCSISNIRADFAGGGYGLRLTLGSTGSTEYMNCNTFENLQFNNPTVGISIEVSTTGSQGAWCNFNTFQNIMTSPLTYGVQFLAPSCGHSANMGGNLWYLVWGEMNPSTLAFFYVNGVTRSVWKGNMFYDCGGSDALPGNYALALVDPASQATIAYNLWTLNDLAPSSTTLSPLSAFAQDTFLSSWQGGLSLGGGLSLPVITKTNTNYDIKTWDAIILVSTGSSARTITLPAAAETPRGQILTIKKTDSGSGTIIVAAASGDTIEGATTKNLAAVQYNMLSLVGDGTATWYITGSIGTIT